MINANELRIGNKLINKKGRILTVMTLQNGNDFDYTIIDFWEKGALLITSSKEDRVDPIPLTPEILEKCGFVFLSVGSRNTSYYIEGIEKDFVINHLVMEGKFLYEDIVVITFHQLQNLYFALTGTELTINL